MYRLSIGLFLCVLICSAFASIVTFLPTSSFNLPINFKDGKLPCSKETVVLPETLWTPVQLESETFVNGLILPNEGDIILAGGTIELGPDDADVNCTRGNVYYIERAVTAWSQPDIWSSPKFNDAIPDAERVPCYDDVVEFPSNATFTLKLPEKEQSVRAIRIGDELCTLGTCPPLLRTDSAQTFISNDYLNFALKFNQEPCQSRSGCPCQKNTLTIKCESKFCSVPTCVDPIKPEGHCCKICGGFINFNIDESFDMMMFKEHVENVMDSYGRDGLIYHLGRLPNNKVQVVVIEKGKYSGTSAQVVNVIDRRMNQHWVHGAKFVGLSGSPLDESGLGGKIFISVFFLVVFVMCGIYVYYYKVPDMSNVQFPILQRANRGVFFRFQTRSDSVVCLTRRDSETPLGRSPGTDFSNPLYESTKQGEEVEQSEDSQ